MAMFIMQLCESLHQFIDTLVANDTTHKQEGKLVILLLDICKTLRIDFLHIHASHIAISQHLHWLLAYPMVAKVAQYALPFRNNVSGASTYQLVHQHQHLPFATSSRWPHQTGEHVYTYRHAREPSGKHRQQSCFRSHRMRHIRTLLDHHPNHPDERP